MEYLDYIKSLSCGDPTQQIPSISRIIWLIKEQPTFILVNTIAITMAVEFTQVSNKVRFFIAEFFRQCSSEMCLIRNKEDFFRNLTSVLDMNNPVAQQLMLKILGYLAPLLTDMLEVHHKVLLTLEGSHRIIRETAFSILPALISYCPSISKHVFEKVIPEHYISKICSVIPDNQEIINKAYSYILRHFGDEHETLMVLAGRSRSLSSHLLPKLLDNGKYEQVVQLCKKFGFGLLEDEDRAKVSRFMMRTQEMNVKDNYELLNLAHLEEQHYKNVYLNWKETDRFEWIIKRLTIEGEAELCFKVLYKLKVPSTYLSNVQKSTLGLALCLIRGGWHSSMYDKILCLNPFDQYQCACEMMTQGLHSEAFTIFSSIKQNLKSESETIFNWIAGLELVCAFEKNKAGTVSMFHCLRSTDLADKAYFHLEFLLCRYLLVNSLNETLSGETPVEKFLMIRAKFDKLLYLFDKPSKDLLQTLKFWRDVSGLLAMALTCLSTSSDFTCQVEKFYSYFSSHCNSSIKTPQHLARIILEYPVKYPRQFFHFHSPISLALQINCSSSVKVNRGTEFILELSVNINRRSQLNRRVQISITSLSPSGKEDLLTLRTCTVNSAGVCNLNIPVVLNTPGQFQFRIAAAVLNELGSEIGKPEYSVLNFECI